MIRTARLLLLTALFVAACARKTTPAAPTPATLARTADTPEPVAPSATPAAPIPAPLAGRITYAHDGDIYVMNADGTGVTRLTDAPAEDFDPSWSPDGAHIAFRSHRDGDEEVYVMNADGTGQRNLTNAPGGDYSPAWSPDGEWIAFMSDRAGGNPDVWLVRPDGSGATQLTDIPGISEYPSWSPDGAQIAFHCTFGRVLPNGTGDFEICTVNRDGSDLRQLTDAPGESKQPAWSPDGATIAFESNRLGWPTLPGYEPPGYDPRTFGDSEIFLMNVDGSGQRNVTNNPREDDTFPAWSPAGDLIFSRYGCLLVIPAGSETPVQLSAGTCAGPDSGQFPDWIEPAT